MFEKKEVGAILISVIILGFVGSWVEYNFPSLSKFLLVGFYFLIIILISTFAKKFSALKYDSELK